MGEPYYRDDDVTLYLGDCREVLPGLDVTPDAAVVDPPYGTTSAAWDRWPEGWVDAVGAVLPASASLWCFGTASTFRQEHHREEIRVNAFTEADVQLVAQAISSACHDPRPIQLATAALAALADAGRLTPDGAERDAAAAALRDVSSRLAATHYMSMGGLPWVSREAMFGAINDSAKAILGGGWVALMRDERSKPEPIACSVCSAPDCRCAMCSMIASGEVPEALSKPHAAEHWPWVEADGTP